MKKKLAITAITAFFSISLMAACNTDNREAREAADQNRQIYDPVSYNQRYNTLGDNRFNMPIYPGRAFDQHPDVYFKQHAIPEYHSSAGPYGNRYQNNNTNGTISNNKATDFQARVILLTNQERAKQGLSALKSDIQLAKVAQTKSDDMAKRNYFSHTSPTYGSPFQMLRTFGVSYSTAAENIAAGQTSPERVVNSWMNSAGHRQNILNKNVTHIGVGYSKDEAKGSYWTQIFIGK